MEQKYKIEKLGGIQFNYGRRPPQLKPMSFDTGLDALDYKLKKYPIDE